MIGVIDGLPGHGKSLWLTEILEKYHKKGCDVLPNYNLYFDEGMERVHKWQDFNECLDEVGEGNGKVIGCDEAYKIFNAQRWQSIPLTYAEKLAEHRHDSLDLWTATQNFGDLWNKVREKVAIWYTCTSLYRYPQEESVPPIFQIIKVEKKRRFVVNQKTVWRIVETKRLYVSKYWTKKKYDSYANLKMQKFLCRMVVKKGKPIFKIASRQAIQAGKVKGWR